MARKKELRFLAPAGLRRAQYEKFFDVISEMAPAIWSDFWAECWPQVRDCEEGFEPVHARKAADAWLRRVGLTGQDGAPPGWMLCNLEMALTTRAILARTGRDPGERFFGIAAIGTAKSAAIGQVFPAGIVMNFRFALEPDRGLEAEKKRILERFSEWLDARIAELAARAGKRALSEETEAQAIRLWVSRWLGREPLADAAGRAGVDLRRAQELVRWTSDELGLRLPTGRGRPKKRE